MKRSKARRPASGAKGSNHRPAKERRLVVLDQGPLRRKAATECSRAMARLEKVRTEWRRFEREDQPGYARWMAATFGALSSRLRETEARLAEKQALVREVELEMVFEGARTYRSAYARVMRRRAQGASARPREDDWHGPPPPPDDDEADFTGGPEIPAAELEALFEDFLHAMMGVKANRMNRQQYEQMFTAFKANVLGQDGPVPPPRPGPAAAPPKPEHSRIKELYRLLVRRLHPDTKADNDATVSALWHDVQEAYGAGNVERLEMLLALTDIQAHAAGAHTSLFQMRAVLAELGRSCNALRRNLRSAKKEPAWNFARLEDRAELQKRMGRELESSLAAQERQLQEMEALIAEWSEPTKARRNKPLPREQAEFFF